MTQFASDSFTGTSGTVLSTYSANWVQHSSFSGNTSTISNANRARKGSSGGTSLYYHTATPSSADYSVSADLFFKETDGGTGTAGVSCRTSTSANTRYTASYTGSSTDAYRLTKLVAGTSTQLGSSISTGIIDETSHNLKVEANGSTISMYIDGSGTASVSVTDTAITDAGKGSILFSEGGTVPSDTNLIHIDNYSANSLETSYSLNPSGQITFSGSATNLRGYIVDNSGQISFSGTAVNIRSRVLDNGGQITFSGTSAFSSDGTSSYTFSISGGIVFSGTAALAASSSYLFVPNGQITFSGSNTTTKTKIITPSGQITFSGSANLYVPESGEGTSQTYTLRRYIGRR